MSLYINGIYFKLKITKVFNKYILNFNTNNTNDIINVYSFEILLKIIGNLFVNNRLLNIQLLINDFVILSNYYISEEKSYDFTVKALEILKSINIKHDFALYNSVLIQETDNILTNTFPQEIIEEICSYLYI